MAEGRFVYLRSFESARMLRIDGLKVYRNPIATGRRLEDVVESASERSESDEELKQTNEHYIQHQSRLGRNMLNLTKTVCQDRTDNPSNAVKVRREAAILWSELDDATAKHACYDCVTLRGGNCTVWFATMVGVRADVGPKAAHARRLRDDIENKHAERRRILEESLEKSCCRTHKVTGVRDCSKRYCHKAVQQNAKARMGHILRRMHEKGHIEMNVEQRVAVDLISPHLHSDVRCRAKDHNSKRTDPLVSDAECLASSLVSHIADKHGVSKSTIDEELGKYGLTVAKMLAQPLQTASSASETVSNFKSNPAFADFAAKVRERTEQIGASRRKLKTSPKGKPLKKASDAILETNDDYHHNTRRSKSRNRKLRSNVNKYLHNVSKFATSIHKTAVTSRATSLMPVIHSSVDDSFTESTKDAVYAVVNADGSLFQTALRSAAAVGNVVSKGAALAEKISKATKDNDATKPRRLSETAVREFYDDVDRRVRSISDGRRLEVNDVGFTLPERHVQQLGWVGNVIDWRETFDNLHQISRTILNRQDARLRHVDEHGHLPSGEIADEFKTGVALLDLNAPPSKIGNMFRELHAWMTNRHGSVERRKHHAQQMKNSISTPRMINSNSHHDSVVASAVEAAALGRDAMDAMRSTLQTTNIHHTSHMRKLTDSFLGAAASVPLLPSSVSNKFSSYQATNGGVDYFNEILRYLVYGKHLLNMVTPTHALTSLCFLQILRCVICTHRMSHTTEATSETEAESRHIAQTECAFL